jgi:S1-C subfamily serine protease
VTTPTRCRLSGATEEQVLRRVHFSKWPGLATTVAALIAVVVVASGCGSKRSASTTSSSTSTKATPSLADVVARVRSGVVRVESQTCGGTAIGTGFLVGPRLVATVQHVIDGASNITLIRNGKRVATATVVGSDQARDLALLRTSAPITGYRFALAKQAPRLGDDVAALGFPLGLPLSFDKGSVSGLDRTVSIEGVNRRRLIQTDAALNPGNSGGPLLTFPNGDVVGLVDLKNTQGSGIAFAVSAQVARPLLEAWRVAPQPISSSNCTSTPTGPANTGGKVADYVNSFDDLLTNYSTQTRADLAQLIDDVKSSSISQDAADAEINSVIQQRQDFLDAARSVTAPATFAQAQQTLEASLQASIDDDQAIGNWIDAIFAADSAGAQQYWAQQQSLSLRASNLKQSFLDQYNALRKQLLQLPPLNIHY